MPGIDGVLDLAQVSTPSRTPAASRDFLYFKSDGLPYFMTPGGVETPFTGGTTTVVNLPIGAISMWGGATTAIPAGYLPCDGTTRPRNTYPELFAALGGTDTAVNKWGQGDGTTTFTLPNLADNFPMGASASKAVGAYGGALSHTHTIQDHYHTTDHYHGTGGPSATGTTASGAGSSANAAHTHTTGGPSNGLSGWTTPTTTATFGSSDVLPNPYATVAYIIRAVASVGGGGGGSSGLALASPALTAGVWATVTHALGLVARDVSFNEVTSGEMRLLDWRVKGGNSTADIEMRCGAARAANYYTIYVEA